MQSPNTTVEYSELQDLLGDFYRLTKIRVSFWNSMGQKCIMVPNGGNSDFCSELRKVADINQQCVLCDEQALHKASQKENALHRFHCPAGLYEYVYPVIYNKTLLGYFMYGQVRNPGSDKEEDQLRERLYATHELNCEYLNILYNRLPIVKEYAMLSAGRMLAALARCHSSNNSRQEWSM